MLWYYELLVVLHSFNLDIIIIKTQNLQGIKYLRIISELECIRVREKFLGSIRYLFFSYVLYSWSKLNVSFQNI